MNFKEYLTDDYYRNTDGKSYGFFSYFILRKKTRMISRLRKCQHSNGFFQLINRLIYKHYSCWNNNNFPIKTNIGKGFYLGHSGGQYINKDARIGENCNINHSVTIGQENRGERLECPTIGSKVWIGCNSVIVRGIYIGDNVFIAPNSFVNFDVLNNSIVIAGKIVSNIDATKDMLIA